MATLEQLKQRLEERSMPEPMGGCIIWLGSTNNGGYGTIAIHHSKTEMVHRVAYFLSKGFLSSKLDIDHKCRVRCCINPGHMELVTRQVNTLRGTGPAAQHAQRTHCNYGHPLTEENLHPSYKWRKCRICAKADKVRYFEKHKEEIRARDRARNRKASNLIVQ